MKSCKLHIDNWWLVSGLAVFTALAIIMLPILNYDYLFAVQDNSLFMKSHTFMIEKLAVPGGFLEWAGCYLVQYFYHPWLGSALLILLWWICVWITIKTFKLKDVYTLLALLPVTALLCSIIDLGYWLYYIKTSGYWFSQTLGLLTMLTAVCGCDFVSKWNKFMATPYIILWAGLGYCLFGWWALLGALIIAVRKEGFWLNRLMSVMCIAVVPWIAYRCYSQFRLDEAWYYGLPLFQKKDFTDWILTTPFFAVIAIVVVLSRITFAKSIKNRLASWSLAVSVLALCIVSSLKLNVWDKNFHTELRMYKAMDECLWQDVVDKFVTSTSPTHQMVMMKNTALIHLGQLGEKMYELGNIGCKPHSGRLDVRMTVTAGPILYYFNGLVNFAYRWSIENEVERGLSVRLLRMMARCAVWQGESELAAKYLTMLSATKYYRQWARERSRMIHDAGAFRQSPDYQAIAPIEVQGDGELDFDNGYCEEYIINNYAYLLPQNLPQQEAAVCYAMMLKNDELIKFQLGNYYEIHPIEGVPKHILEAVDIYNQNHSPAFQKFTSDYQMSLGMGRRIGDLGRDMKKDYAGSYWWYYYFYNDFNIY